MKDTRYLTFALCKGRLAKQTLELLEELGITCEEMKDKNSRKLIFVNEELKLKFFLSKGPDVPTYVEYGAADIGVVGKDTILEAGKEVSDALHLYDATNRKLIQDKAQIEELEKAVTYTNALFQSGQSTYLEILSAQQSLLSAQLTEVSDNVQRMQAVINLYSAVGGGRE